MAAGRYTLKSGDHLVFIHILKTAGQTLMPILRDQFEPGESFFGNWPDIKARTADELSRYRLIMGHNFPGIADRISGQAVFITFLRDPVERTLSHFSY